MAATKHGAKTTRGRSRRAPTRRKPRSGRATGRPAAPRGQLEEIIQTLRLALSVVVVSVAALRQQDADNDDEIARVLARHVADRLDVAIERAEAVLATLSR